MCPRYGLEACEMPMGAKEGSVKVRGSCGSAPVEEEGESVVVGGPTCVDRYGHQSRPLVSGVVAVMLSKG